MKTRLRAQPLVLAVLAALLSCLVLGWAANASASANTGKRYYASRKPALKVELTIYRHHIYRASVSAVGVCSNGEPYDGIGFGIVGGSGLPIRGRAHRFNDTVVGTTNSSVFRGRVEGDKVVGVYQQMLRLEPPQEGGKEELPHPQCGSGSLPRGEFLHFTAKRVGAKQVPPSMR